MSVYLICVRPWQVVLSAILPHYIDYLKCDSSGAGALSEDKMKKELAGLTSLATSMQVLVKSCEVLTRYGLPTAVHPTLAQTTVLPNSTTCDRARKLQLNMMFACKY